jgi:hypothetical protein
VSNQLTHVGEQMILEIAFRGGATFANLTFGLTNAALDPTNNLADAQAGEPAGQGSAEVTITQDSTGWPSDGSSGAGWLIASEDIVFTASGGDITPFNKVFLTDGTNLIAFWDVGSTTITNGNSLTFQARLKLT